jgi:hypothetical protein
VALPITVGATINVRHCAGQNPTTGTVSAVDTGRQTVTLVYTSGALVSQPGGTVALSMCRLTTDPYQQPVPVGPIWGL